MPTMRLFCRQNSSKITTQYLALKGGTPLRDRRDRRLPLRDHTATYLPSAKTALDRTSRQVKS